MLTRKLYSKFFQVNGFGADFIALLHRDGAIINPSLSKCHKNQIFSAFSSIVDLNPSGSNSKSKNETKIAKKLAKDNAYAVSYLMKSCGLSREMAITASKQVHFDTPEKPDSVLALFKRYGFNDAQILNLVRIRPVVPLHDPEKNLLPKLEFFRSIGISEAALASIFSGHPTLLSRSLEKTIIPHYNFLKTVLSTSEDVLIAMQRWSWYFREGSIKNVASNVAVLKDLNVPNSSITFLLKHFPESLRRKSSEFKASVSKVLEMEFNPLKSVFVMALHVISGKPTRGTWSRCFQTYMKWGWSKDDIGMAFKKSPFCMLMSEKKISRAMDLLVNKMGWDSRMIARCPSVLCFSLERRLLPRCSVAKVLFTKGLIDKDVSLNTLLISTEKYFLKKFV